MDNAPSMVQRAGDTLIVRRVVSGEQLILDQDGSILENYRRDQNDRSSDIEVEESSPTHNSTLPIPLNLPAVVAALAFQQQQQQKQQQLEAELNLKAKNSNNAESENTGNLQSNQHLQDNEQKHDNDYNLPQCKIKRNYSCNNCPFFTQNPRLYLTHLRDVHGEKIVINECKFCLYASRHYQKLVRHMKMVHGSTEGINEPNHIRRRVTQNKELKKNRLLLESKAQQLQQQQRSSPVTSSNFFNSNIHSPKNAHYFDDSGPINLSQHGNLMLSNQIDQFAFQHKLLSNAIENQPNPFMMVDDIGSIDLSMNAPNQDGTSKVSKCIICNYAAPNEEMLISHEKTEHNKTKFFRCEKCSYVTNIKARFSKHVKYHSMPMIKCMMCDFRTPYKWNLDRHMKNHGGTGAFKCSVCNFTADIKQSLTVHEMNHHVPPLANSFALKDDELGSNFEDEIHKNQILNQHMSDNFSSSFQRGGDDSSNNSHNDNDNYQAGQKRKKPIPDLIPIKNTPALNLSTSSSESNKNNDSESVNNDEKEMQMKLISSLLSKNELSVESILSSGLNNETLALKKKNASFFDGLREKLINNTGDAENLICKCDYEAKSLSDLIIHQKACGKSGDKGLLNPFANRNTLMNSTRCQYCRHRCKSSVDLAAHLQTCSEAQAVIECIDSSSDANGDDKNTTPEDYLSDEAIIDNPNERHPMENVVFVWNNIQKNKDDGSDLGKDQKLDDSDDNHLLPNAETEYDDEMSESSTLKNSEYLGVESAPGYGEITKKLESSDELGNTAMKKVFKCPHCSFWASTASRFHVHIVGHLNKKPFECSLCAYRSNWRWDITKHIRLKLLRDPSHGEAKVLMNDETGRRNYSKYNKYITLMRVVDKKHDGKQTKSGSVTMTGADNILISSPVPSLAQMSSLQDGPKISAPTELLLRNSVNEMSPSDLCINLLKSYQQNFNDQAFNFSNIVAHVLNNPNLIQNQNENNSTQELEKVFENQPTESTKKTHFKCKKCNFKDADREVVLNHVKGHYEDGDQSTSEVNVPSPLPFTMNTAISQYLSSVSNNSNNISGNNTSQVPSTQSYSISMNLSNPGNMVISNNSTASNAVVSAPINTTGTNTTASILEKTTEQGSKGSFKCGHCGQVSNWKHVIQRHCRLKHNGDISIEINGQKNEKSKHRQEIHLQQIQPQSQQQQNQSLLVNPNLTFPTQTFKPSELTLTPINTKSIQEYLNKGSTVQQTPLISVAKDSFLKMKPIESNMVKEQALRPPSLQMSLTKDIPMRKIVIPPALAIPKIELDDDDEEEEDVNMIDTSEIQQQMKISDEVSINKSKRYKCDFCPYETDSKSQFIHHKGFHKPRNESFQCKYCSYNVSKRHLLNQHQKMHQCSESSVSVDNNQKTIPEVNETHLYLNEKLMHFCSQCPARYLSLREIIIHLKMHEAPSQIHKCKYCTFSAADDSVVKAHSAVHTTYYQEKTKEFIAKYKIASNFRNSDLTLTKHDIDGVSDEIWIVSNPEQPEKSQQDDSNDEEDGKFAERCPHCPMQALSLEILKDHLQHHSLTSGVVYSEKCSHCDYSSESAEELQKHIKLHFCAITDNKKLDFYTSFCGLELSITKINNINSEVKSNSNVNSSNDNNNNSLDECDSTVIYRESEKCEEMEDTKLDKIVVDI